MIKKQTIKVSAAALLLGAGFSFITVLPVYAADCAGVSTAIIECTASGQPGIEGTGLWSVLILAINILTGLVAVAALGGLVYGAVLYTSAGGSSEQVKKAMGIITNVVIGILAYALMYVGLNFLVPGGVFN